MSKNNNVLFIGNGINSILDGYDWNQLLVNLFKKYKVDSKLYAEKQSFPLVYEEIFLKLIKRGKVKENQIKEFISEDVKKLKPSSVHELIMNSNCNELITSNYDYTLQKVKNSDSTLIKNHSKTKENTYSIFRHNLASHKRIWHMHGEINSPSSIILGYEQYIGNVQKMRTYMTKGTSSLHKNLHIDALTKRLGNNNEIYSWIDLFFKNNIHLIGLNLSFEEIDLWWLLTYRARKKSTNFKNKIKNKITYYIPKNYVKKADPKLELLKATGVIIKEIDCEHNEKYYSHIINLIDK